MNIVGIAGSPTRPSRSTALLRAALQRLAGPDRHQALIEVAELPAEALLRAHTREPSLSAALDRVLAADVVLVATPIYKAAYSGVLKAFLDLLPQEGLRGKQVLALGSGGSLGHLLALDYALKPVLAALGARHILDGVFAEDAQFTRDVAGHQLSDGVLARLDKALAPLGLAAARGPSATTAVLPATGAGLWGAPVDAHLVAQVQAAFTPRSEVVSW